MDTKEVPILNYSFPFAQELGRKYRRLQFHPSFAGFMQRGLLGRRILVDLFGNLPPNHLLKNRFDLSFRGKYQIKGCSFRQSRNQTRFLFER
jgi:hypothetical protein